MNMGEENGIVFSTMIFGADEELIENRIFGADEELIEPTNGCTTGKGALPAAVLFPFGRSFSIPSRPLVLYSLSACLRPLVLYSLSAARSPDERAAGNT